MNYYKIHYKKKLKRFAARIARAGMIVDKYMEVGIN